MVISQLIYLNLHTLKNKIKIIIIVFKIYNFKITKKFFTIFNITSIFEKKLYQFIPLTLLSFLFDRF